MQNGFPPPSSILTPHPFNQSTVKVPSSTGNANNTIIVTEDQRWTQQNEDLLQWTSSTAASNSNAKLLNTYPVVTPQKPHKSKRGGGGGGGGGGDGTNDQMNKATNGVSNNNVTKRYSCSSCPYSTDRRDLYTRHENIHKEEKPFHCYACLKMFNRADHVKKHFLRMHREMNYDINKTRRTSGNKPITHSSPYFNAQLANQHPPQQQQTSTNNNGTILSFPIPHDLQTATTAAVMNNSEAQQQQQHSAPDSPTSVNVSFKFCFEKLLLSLK